MCFMSPYDWANGGSVSILVLWEVGAILGNGYGVEGQNYITLLQEKEC